MECKRCMNQQVSRDTRRECTAAEDKQDLKKKKKWYFCVPCWNSGCLTWTGTAAARTTLPITVGVRSIFMCPNNGTAASAEILNVCIYVDAGDCTQGLYRHHKSQHWKPSRGEKSLATAGTQTCVGQYCAWLFNQTLCQLNYPHPSQRAEPEITF